MRKIIFSIPITIDGFIEGPHQERDWVIPDAELHDFYTNLMQDGDLLIFGRVTYELMAGYWPTAPSDPNATEAEKRFANTLNPKKKIVFSRTLGHLDWNTQVIREFDPEDIKIMKSQPGGNILLSGGAAMAQVFFKYGLVDEYIPVIQPVAIGKGKALFAGLQQLPRLAFLGNQRFHSGTLALRYQVIGKV